MHKQLTGALTLCAALGFSHAVLAAQPSEDATLHFQAISKGDVAQLMGDYADNAQLNWVGGPLDGTYRGTSDIRSVWDKFSKAQGPLKLSMDTLQESANPKGATVIANVQFTGKQPINVRYVLTYRKGKIASETWQIVSVSSVPSAD